MVKVQLSGGEGSAPQRQQEPQGEPLFMPWVVLYDHRERAAGWRFGGIVGDSRDKWRPIVVPQKESHLVTADYTIEGCPVFIERKSQEDFLSTITHGHENFRKEHERMAGIIAAGGNCCVIVEADYGRMMDELCVGSGRIHPNSIAGAVASMPLEFGVPWFFAGSRRGAEVLAFRVLRNAWDRFQEKGKSP